MSPLTPPGRRGGAMPMALAAIVMLLGAAVIARTIAAGVGGGLGLLLGGLMLLGGALRLYLVGPWRKG